MALCRAIACVRLPALTASWYFSSATFRLLTYALMWEGGEGEGKMVEEALKKSKRERERGNERHFSDFFFSLFLFSSFSFFSQKWG
jgi:hypothetical protein